MIWFRQSGPTKKQQDRQPLKTTDQQDDKGNDKGKSARHGASRKKYRFAVLLFFLSIVISCIIGLSQESVALLQYNEPLQELDNQGTDDNGDRMAQMSLEQREKAVAQGTDYNGDRMAQMSLEQWEKTVYRPRPRSFVNCMPTPWLLGERKLGILWAYDDPPEEDWVNVTLASLPTNPKVTVWCGSAECEKRANHVCTTQAIKCVQVEGLSVLQLATDTPLEGWVSHHVLAKLLSGPHYEEHLQLAMQLSHLWKYGGLVITPGIRYDAKILGRGEDFWGTCSDAAAPSSPNGGGFHGISAAQPQSPWVETMMQSLLSAYHWEKSIRDRYQPSRWPIHFDTEDLIPSTVRTMKLGELCPPEALEDRGMGPKKYYGTLSYDERHKFLVEVHNNHGMNLGDETQGLAGIQALPRLDAFVERDRLEMVKFIDQSTPPLGSMSNTSHSPASIVSVYFNAWWGTPTMTWPPPPYIRPVALSMHFQPIKAIYNKVMPPSKKNGKGPMSPAASFLHAHAPIGARDTKTLKFLQDNGIQTLFSACLTMTLSLPRSMSDGSILIVDVDASEHLRGVVPDKVLDQATFLTQKLMGSDAEDGVLRYVLAFERLLAYSRSRLVITNRLHVAMPCVALGIPVIFVNHKGLPGGGGNRMDGLDVFMHQIHGTSVPDGFDWSNPPPNPRAADFQTQVRRIQQLAICHSEISDSARKFGVRPPDLPAIDAHAVCTWESAWSANPDAIHISTTLDAQFFELVFPSWLNALAKSNSKESLVLYILTVKLSEKQECYLRLMVLRLLPNAKVFTISTNLDKFEKKYAAGRHNHVSLASQSRLLLPSLLPCVRKLLWIDLDAFLVGPIRPLWNQETGICGIAARSSLYPYMADYEKSFPTLATWHETYGKSFNAGVMVLDLQKLRETKFEETIVAYWAAALGANDQMTFNLACNATHRELDPRMNVFQGQTDESTPERDQWIIAHFQSQRKPWSDKWDEAWSSKDFLLAWKQSKMTFAEILDM